MAGLLYYLSFTQKNIVSYINKDILTMVQSYYIFMITTLDKTYELIVLDGLIFLNAAYTCFNQNKTH
jgi:hypothetical protein